MYNFMTAFLACTLIVLIGDWVSRMTKGWLPSVFVSAVLILIGYWTVLPKTLVSDAYLIPMGATISIFLIITHMGTMISPKELMAQWKTVTICLMGLVGMTLFAWFLCPLFMDRVMVIAGLPPLAGGIVAATMMQDAAAKAGELLGIGKEFHYFGELLLGFVHPGHIVEGHAHALLIEHARPRTAEAHGLAGPAALHLADDEDPHADEQQQRQPVQQQAHVPGGLFRRLGLHFHFLAHELRDKIGVVGSIGLHLRPLFGAAACQDIALDGDGQDLPGVHPAHEIRITYARGR